MVVRGIAAEHSTKGSTIVSFKDKGVQLSMNAIPRTSAFGSWRGRADETPSSTMRGHNVPLHFEIPN